MNNNINNPFSHYIFLKESGGVIALDDKAFNNLTSHGDSTEYVDGKAVRTRTFVFQYVDTNDLQIEIR